jgi:exopolysaccharide production protein ExoZ
VAVAGRVPGEQTSCDEGGRPPQDDRWGAGAQAGPTASRPTYRLIQILRALAALMVVAHHATIMLWERDRLPVPNWIAGSSGVDIFFVISGFVMTISSAPLRSTEHPARTFLARRVERIVPMYWLVTIVKVVVLLLAPAVALNGLGSVQHILGSFLFFPSLSAEGRLEPVVVVGWTLNFEMAFYLLFAAALALRWRPVWVLSPLLLLLPLTPITWLLKLPYQSWFYFSTVLWEFVFGMVLALLVHKLRRLPWWLGALLFVAGMCPLLTWNLPGVSYWRGAMWGLPALAVVAGALILEKSLGERSPRWLLELGDASYSIYLIHTFTLPAIGLWLARWPHHWPGEIATAMLAAVALSALSGEVVYRLVERPVMGWFKGRRRTAVPVNG